jgi:hypothetical protein
MEWTSSLEKTREGLLFLKLLFAGGAGLQMCEKVLEGLAMKVVIKKKQNIGAVFLA